MATRWGIASSGRISHDFVNALKTLPEKDHKLVAVAARSLNSAVEFQKKFDIEHAYQGYEKLAQDSEVEVVYIGSINIAHLELARMMLDHGKHVLCEKPLCMNVKETRELVKYAREKKLFLMEAVWSTFMPAYSALRSSLDSGIIGEVKNVLVTFGQIIDVPRLYKKELGGGTVLDLGVYCLQLAQLAMRKEKPVKVIAGGHLTDDGVDESTSATLIYSEGKTATCVTSGRVALPCEGVIVGTKGTIKLPFPFWTPTELITPNETLSWPLPTGAPYKFNFFNSEQLAYEAQHVRECLLEGKTESPLISLDESLQLAELMEDIRKQVGVIYPQDE